MTTPTSETAVIGFGDMGYQMARHMINAGFTVSGCDVAAEPARRAAKVGVKICESPAELDESYQVVIVMVATDAQVEDVVVNSGLLDRLQPGAVICVSSSSQAHCSTSAFKRRQLVTVPLGQEYGQMGREGYGCSAGSSPVRQTACPSDSPG